MRLNKSFVVSALLLAIIFSQVPNASAQTITATIIDFGETVPIPSDIAIDSEDSHTGSLFVMDAEEVPTFKSRDDKSKIAIQLGAHFGIEVQLEGGKDMAIIPVKTRWTHPKFADGVEVEEWDSPMNIGLGRYAGWVIENESEMVAGNWTVEILYKGESIAKKTFEISLATPK